MDEPGWEPSAYHSWFQRVMWWLIDAFLKAFFDVVEEMHASCNFLTKKTRRNKKSKFSKFPNHLITGHILKLSTVTTRSEYTRASIYRTWSPRSTRRIYILHQNDILFHCIEKISNWTFFLKKKTGRWDMINQLFFKPRTNEWMTNNNNIRNIKKNGRKREPKEKPTTK